MINEPPSDVNLASITAFSPKSSNSITCPVTTAHAVIRVVSDVIFANIKGSSVTANSYTTGNRRGDEFQYYFWHRTWSKCQGQSSYGSIYHVYHNVNQSRSMARKRSWAQAQATWQRISKLFILGLLYPSARCCYASAMLWAYFQLVQHHR